MVQPLLLHAAGAGPNPWKVILLLEELQLPYEVKHWTFPELKQAEFGKLSVNGRAPVIQDPNTGVRLWETGAIIEYLIDTYDKSHSLTYTTSPETWHLKQWLYFQTTTQGPYFGQKFWFTHFHPEKIQSAVDRYAREVDRVVMVIDSHLQQTGGQYLVGDKYTYADLAFITWFEISPRAMQNPNLFEDWAPKYPAFSAWWKRISGRPVTVKVLQSMRGLLTQQQKDQALPPK
ncbi:hypothetical protein ANO11243_026470 [Dothideomycetidae sp. 11243]|nr:hypothetical protein ANO11243_026470 [fungal sp. No.11243]